ncbi:META domain-containing protein [Hymenobacter chitinivorans]|uniref:Heat shock protein HslJ n=1 Tax=Hymenobacter chitinivorans DSM 11115 TaxID=1121954 RepID=A0A2M9BNZ5_9BACT|nr:META domain-containing protein [Hymenobacter chitinivorans]PJJ59674.1 heat shock protein HslJ [Hymenobacter chitinivorans DSM 11115]
MIKRLLPLSSAILISLLTGCRASAPAPLSQAAEATIPTAELRNTRWVLRSLQNRAILTPTNGEAYLLLRNDEQRAEGNAGCNRFRGTFTGAQAGQLQFGPLLSTRMACLSEQDNATEKDFLAALAATRTYQISGDTLRLYSAEASQPQAVLHAVYLH